MNKKRASEISELIGGMSHRIPASQVDTIWNIYSQEVHGQTYRVKPCTCNPNDWKNVLAEIRVKVDSVLAEKKK